jgi:pimeloyl-ACP methyl ester carboxylesterase
VLLHGLTATRRYVVMGSRLLERRGYRVVSYDARGHGRSAPAPSADAYEYSDQLADLRAALERLRLERVVLAGSSMGAATALAFVLEEPERVIALVQCTPAYAGRPRQEPELRAEWAALADGLERAGVEGFMEAYEPDVGERWRDPVLRLTRQRMERHQNPRAVADALRVVPFSAPFVGMEPLERIETPTLVVASRDGADPGHPLAVAEAYVERLPNAQLVVEEPGRSPLAWRGAQLSRTIDEFLRRVAPEFAPARATA